MNTIKTALLTTVCILTAYTSKAQTFKEPVSFKLKNGMNVIVSENSRSPKAYSSFTLDAGAFKDRKDGVVELLNAILNENVSKNANISFKDNSGKLSTLAADLDQDLSLMASFIQNPKLDKGIFNTAKAKLITSLKLQDYDYDQTVNENSINTLTLADVQDFYNQITPAKTFLTIAGDVELASAKTSVKKAFSSWNKIEKQGLVLAETK